MDKVLPDVLKFTQKHQANEEQWWAPQWSYGAWASLEQIEPHRLEMLKAEFFDGLQVYKQNDGIHNTHAGIIHLWHRMIG